MTATPGKDGRVRCPKCGRIVKTVTTIPPGGLPLAGKYYELDGERITFADDAEFGKETADGQAVYCPRGHRVSQTTT